MFFPRASQAVVLHYTTSQGIDFIGAGYQIIRLPLIGTIFILLNSALGYSIRRVMPEITWLFLASLPILQAVILTAVLLLHRLNA